MSGPIAMATSKITGLGTPTATTDATTKVYVDGVVNTANIEMLNYVDAANGLITSHSNTNDSLRVLRTMRIESPSMHWKTMDLGIILY